MKFNTSFPKHKFKVAGMCFTVLSVLTGCFGSSPTDKAKKALSSGQLQICPGQVHVWAQAGGVISLNWGDYSPNINTYATMLIVPNDGRQASNVSDTNTNGVFTVPGHVAGNYTVYYNVRPGSPDFPACAGVENIKFW